MLQNFKIDNTRTQLETQTIQQQIADLDLRATVASTVAQVRNTYWELVFAYQQVEASQRSLELAAKLVSDNKMRVEIGTMAPIDVVQAQAEEASRRQQLVNSQAILRNSELALKRLIVGGTDDELWNATINPVDRPSPQPEPINLESAVTNALQNRTDLATSRKNIESTNVTLRSLKNQTLPGLNLVTHLPARRTRRDEHPPRSAGPHHPGRLLGRIGEHRRLRRTDVDAAPGLQLPHRPERGGSQRRAAADHPAAEPDADQNDGAADCNRGHRRRARRHQRARSAAGRARPRASCPSVGSKPRRASSRSAWRPTSRSSRRSAI